MADERRKSERIHIRLTASLEVMGIVVPCVVRNISDDGALLFFDEGPGPADPSCVGQEVELTLNFQAKKESKPNCRVVRFFEMEGGTAGMAVVF